MQRSMRFSILRSLAKRFLPAYRMRPMDVDWQSDPEFCAYLKRFGQSTSMTSGRRWAVHQLLRLVDSVEGDTAECGVHKGAMSFLICKSNEASAIERTHFLFDSFEGLSTSDRFDGTHWSRGDLSIDEETVARNLAGCRVQLMRGWIPARFPEVADRTFAFVHIDVDLYQPTLDSLEFFYPRLGKGGIIVIDDYGFLTCPGATKACDEYFAGKPEKPIALVDGGAFVIKGTKSGARAALI